MVPPSGQKRAIKRSWLVVVSAKASSGGSSAEVHVTYHLFASMSESVRLRAPTAHRRVTTICSGLAVTCVD